MKKIIVSTVIAASAFLVVTQVSAVSDKINMHTQSFSVKTGASRVIYSEKSKGAVITVENPQDYPILVQSRVYTENKKDPASFIVTPPLFRLDGHQQNRLRIISTGDVITPDREQLYWLCLTGIPPEADSLWAQEGSKKNMPDRAELLVQYRVQNCLKLFTRPQTLKGSALDRADSLVWARDGNTLKVSNPTPFYINFKSIGLGNKTLTDITYISPFSRETFSLPADTGREIRWTLITDYGGVSREFRTTLK